MWGYLLIDIFSYSEIAKEPIWEFWYQAWWRRLCWNMPCCEWLHHHLCVRRGHGRSHTLQFGWVEELPRRQESSCWTGNPNYYQEHPPPRLEDDGRHRHHLELHMHACGCWTIYMLVWLPSRLINYDLSMHCWLLYMSLWDCVVILNVVLSLMFVRWFCELNR